MICSVRYLTLYWIPKIQRKERVCGLIIVVELYDLGDSEVESTDIFIITKLQNGFCIVSVMEGKIKCKDWGPKEEPNLAYNKARRNKSKGSFFANGEVRGNARENYRKDICSLRRILYNETKANHQLHYGFPYNFEPHERILESQQADVLSGTEGDRGHFGWEYFRSHS